MKILSVGWGDPCATPLRQVVREQKSLFLQNLPNQWPRNLLDEVGKTGENWGSKEENQSVVLGRCRSGEDNISWPELVALMPSRRKKEPSSTFRT